MNHQALSRWLIPVAVTAALAGCDDAPKPAAPVETSPSTAASSRTTAKSATSAPSAEAGLRAPKPKPYDAPEEQKLGTLPEGVGIAVGQTAPDFEVTNIDGKPAKLAKIAADGTVLLFFYRGGW